MSEIPCDCCNTEGDHPSRIICDACFQSAKGKAKCCIDTQAENKRLKKEFCGNAAIVYNQAILATPTGKLRNKLTELNILRLQALQEKSNG